VFDTKPEAAIKALHNFLPRAGGAYTSNRNYDYGPMRRENVSMLSPWIRIRILSEWQILGAALQLHSSSSASKFIDEVCWRTYWKGWLELRPSVWEDYILELAQDRERWKEDVDYNQIITARSGIEAMDVWTRELIETGYLHNHARMWYASIWIHTLKLPWTLGADFFLRHLLDGDAASNTLSWRWVAGLHTKGKVYLAQKSNIYKFTAGRHEVVIPLATQSAEIETNQKNTTPRKLAAYEEPIPHGRVGLLVHEEDLSAVNWLADSCELDAVAGMLPFAAYQKYGIAEKVIQFRSDCMRSALPDNVEIFSCPTKVAEWAHLQELDAVIMSAPPVGFWNDLILDLESSLTTRGIRIIKRRHWWDSHFYPAAGAGFFKYKKLIPSVLVKLVDKQTNS
jgi:deoxyribodipyrimidine photo-lyase